MGGELHPEAAHPPERIRPDADQSRLPVVVHQTPDADRILGVRPAHHPVHPGPENHLAQYVWGVWAVGHQPGSLVPGLPEYAGILVRRDCQRVGDRKSGAPAECRCLRLRQQVCQAPLLPRPAQPEPCTPGAVRFVASLRGGEEAQAQRAARVEVLPQPAWRRQELALGPFLRQPEPPEQALLLARGPAAEPQEQ